MSTLDFTSRDSPCEALQEPVLKSGFLERLRAQRSFPHIPREPTGLQHLTRATQPGPQYLGLEVQSQVQGRVTQQDPHVLWGGITVATQSQYSVFSASHPTEALLSYFCTYEVN
jgi:hypothetical protein